MKLTAIDKSRIVSAGMVTAEIQNDVFQGYGFLKIRNCLEENGLDRHMPIELTSTEIALLTPQGVLMQSRPSDRGQLGMWGGVVEHGETPIEGAIRELREELGLEVAEEQLEFVEIDIHDHEYANGDKAHFKCYRYILKLDYVPKVTFDSETSSAIMVVHTIISHQQNFIKRVLGEI